MVQSRIKPHPQQVEQSARRAEQHGLFRCNQIFASLTVAALAILWTLLPTNPPWIFPKGW